MVSDEQQSVTLVCTKADRKWICFGVLSLFSGIEHDNDGSFGNFKKNTLSAVAVGIAAFDLQLHLCVDGYCLGDHDSTESKA